VKISSTNGGDISWSATAPVKPRTDYRLTGWIKTEKVQKVGRANGAMLNVHELQDPVRGGTKALSGDNDWTQVQLNFNSGDMREVTINCLFGGWAEQRARRGLMTLNSHPPPVRNSREKLATSSGWSRLTTRNAVRPTASCRRWLR
jgi:hypothetical protein